MSEHETHDSSDEQSEAGGRELTSSNSPQPDEQATTGERRARGRPLPTREDILGRLDALGQLVPLDIVTPSKAGCMRSIYATLLEHLDAPATGAAPQLTDTTLQALRANPELLDLFATMLSDEMLAKIMEGYRDDARP